MKTPELTQQFSLPTSHAFLFYACTSCSFTWDLSLSLFIVIMFDKIQGKKKNHKENYLTHKTQETKAVGVKMPKKEEEPCNNKNLVKQIL